MNSLLISDLHFTNHQRDSYRWKLFSWLNETIPKYDVKYLWVLGDITEEKDRHPAQLVNKVVDSLLDTYRRTGLSTIYILRGNHDGLDPNTSYFKFLGKYPCIQFVETPAIITVSDREVLMLPHTTSPKEAWKNVDMHKADVILMHATVKGAISESGMQLDGIPPGLLATAHKAKIYSGDIHTPQVVKFGRLGVEYVGAPYPVRFGDSFEPRAILLENMHTAHSLPVPALQRKTITVTALKHELPSDLRKGDQVKIRIRLNPSEYGDWAAIKKHMTESCVAAGVELCGLELEKPQNKIKLRAPVASATKDPTAVFSAFCSSNKITDTVATIGKDILKAVS